MTQSELAQKAGVTQRLVSDFERGKVDIRVDTLCRLFIALDLCLSGIDERLACENEDPPEWVKMPTETYLRDAGSVALDYT